MNLKQVQYDIEAVDLVAGDQRSESYRFLTPSARVPTLVLEDGTVLSQSLAIIEYIDAAWPDPKLISADPLQRARVQAVAQSVA